MKKLSTGKIAAIVIGAILLIFIFFGIGSYNNLVGLKETVNTQSSNIDTQLQRRTDLIPNLVNTVKGYAAHETGIMTAVSEARAKLAGATTVTDKANANAELTGALNRLIAISESYPDLKANTTYIQLMDELAGTENRISVSRQDYNSAAKKYNSSIKTFPNVIFANIFGFSGADYFEAQSNATTVPSVDFES